MPEVLEIEQVEIEQIENDEIKIASWLAEIPENVIKELGLAEDSRIALTFKNGEVSGIVLPPSSERMKEISRQIFEENREIYQELKRLGD